MTTSNMLAAALLKRLGGVTPGEGAQPRTPVSEAGFAELLQRAQSDGPSREVSIDRAAGVELSREQLARVAKAADQAEAAGAGVAAVLIDGMALKLDVLGRRILSKSDGVLTDVDAVVAAPQEARSDAAPVGPPPSAADNASLVRLLAERDNAA